MSIDYSNAAPAPTSPAVDPFADPLGFVHGGLSSFGGVLSALPPPFNLLGPSASAAQSSANAIAGTGGTGWFAEIENVFERGGLIIIGLVIVAIALWALLAKSGAMETAARAAAL